MKQIYDVAKTLSRSQTRFIIRSCITQESVERIPEIARWIAQEFAPAAWCIEPLTADPLSLKAGLRAPDPWKFAQNFWEATQILEVFGIEVVNSTVELGNPQISCCPVGRDAIIVSPDGYIDACYLLEKDWLAKGMNMRFGKVASDRNDIDGFHIDPRALDNIRQLNIYNRRLCQQCFCKFSCAGGCHVNHVTSADPGNFDDLCIYTRLITISKMLHILGQTDLTNQWWSRKENLDASVLQSSDRLIHAGGE